MPDKPSVLLVDDEETIRRVLARELEACGLEVTPADSAASARKCLSARAFDAMVLDIRMPGIPGDAFLQEVHAAHADLPVIILTGHANVELAVKCMREGAFDLVTKPCSVEHLHLTIRRALDTQSLRDQARTLSAYARPIRGHGRLVGASPALVRMRSVIARVAPTEEPVLIVGESGTGKELIAKEIVDASRRASRPFLTVNCAAVAETLLESELFGHEKGAFSGAEERRLGFFELAHEGTVFLDEIGDMPLTMQPKLLRVLQSGEFRRVGGNRALHADVRIIAATNKSLAEEVAEGRFREDLMHRVNTIVLEAPPLRDRPEDLDVLTAYFVSEMEEGSKRRFGDAAIGRMRSYPWPGNIRELRNVVRRALILSDRQVLEPEDLPQHIAQAVVVQAGAFAEPTTNPLQLPLAEVEKRHILAVLADSAGNKTAAARRLGISTKTLYNKFEAWGMLEDSGPDQP